MTSELKKLHQRASDHRVDLARAGRNKEALGYEWFRDRLAVIIQMMEHKEDDDLDRLQEEINNVHPGANKPQVGKKKKLR